MRLVANLGIPIACAFIALYYIMTGIQSALHSVLP